MNIRKWLSTVCVLPFFSANAFAAYTVYLYESSGDVIAYGSGSINLAGTDIYGSANFQGLIDSQWGWLFTGASAQAPTRGIATGPFSFGNGIQTTASSSSGDFVGIIGSNQVFFVPADYVSGSPLTSTATWNATTLATLGATPGTYTWTWGSGATADSYTVHVGQPPAPVDGACGTDHGTTLTTTPTDLCTAGTPSGVTAGNTSYDWSCTGAFLGSTAACSATRNYVVTSSVSGGNGTISASQNVTYNATPSFTLTPASGYGSGPVSGTCGGSLSGDTYTTSAVTQNCTVVASFSQSINGTCGAADGMATAFSPSSNLCATGTAGPVSATGSWSWTCSGSNGGNNASCSAPYEATPTGTGTGKAEISGGTWAVDAAQSTGFIATSGDVSGKSPPSLPRGYSFPHGLFDFVLTGGGAGTTATITITYPTAIPANAVYWKYGPSPAGYNCSGAACSDPHWYQMPPAQAVFAGNTVTLTITDGGVGDDDLMANGVIVDQGGQGVPDAASIPTLSEWGMIFLSGLLAFGTLITLRHQRN